MKRRQESCWERKSRLEKILIFIVAILLCFVLALVVVLLLHYGRVFQNTGIRNVRSTSTCMTPQCVQVAAQIIDFIDPSVDPCHNFYDFACGTFVKKSIERRETSTFSRLSDITKNRLEALISKPTTEASDKTIQLVGKFYRSCMNTTAIEKDNNNALLNLIVKIGESPFMLDRLWNENKFHWLWTMVKCRNLGAIYEHFMKITAAEETINGTKMILLSISPPEPTRLPIRLREEYLELMTNLFVDLNATSRSYVKLGLSRARDFEDQINGLIQEQEMNGHTEQLQVKDLQKDYPSIPWVYFLNNITVTSVPFTNNSWISFGARNYLSKLIDLLEQNPKTTQANYVILKLVESYANYWNKEQRTRYNSFLVNLTESLPFNGDRKTFCISQVKDYFPSVVEVAYIRKYMEPEIRGDINEMLEEIRNQLIIRIKNNDWLDDKSKTSAEIKLKEIQWLIGASGSVFNDSFEKIVNMEEFDLNTNNVVDIIQTLNVRKADNYFRHINKELSVVEEVLETSLDLDVNVLYKQKLNTLVLFAPILQSIFYSFDHPQYMNYGGVGSIIGHEFVHGLTSEGNKEDTLNMSWPSGTREKYEEKVNCLLQEYQNYTHQLEEFTDDGTVVLAETLADFIGPNLGYEAYQKWVQYHPQEENLPGLDYTPNQMFWIMFGIGRCHQPRFKDDYSDDSDYGIPSFAVSFSVKNSPDFARDFHCAINSEMNPEKKCQIL